MTSREKTGLAGKTLLASGFHMPERGRTDELADALIEIDADGVILSVTRPGDEGYARREREALDAGLLEMLPKGQVLLPGFVDLHVHAPQYPQLGQALDVPLEVWLHQYTFPLEARYADLAFARRSYDLLVKDLLSDGTTTALYYATVHTDATKLLADICLTRGQRALIGKVAMDNADTCPDYYRDASPEAALAGTLAVIDHIKSHPDNTGGRVHPVITPRFIPSCTDAALEGLGALAKSCGCPVQTHCSESDWAHAYVLERHGMTDTASLDRFGLLGRRSVLAHSNFITPEDIETLLVRRSAVAHCPLSNAYFAGAVFPLKAALDQGLHLGLGTDISGGPNGSMLDSMRGAMMVSRMLESGTDPDLPPEARSRHTAARIDFRDAFWLATSGGGAALDLPIGQFAPGYRFDALAIDTGTERGTIRLWEEFDSGEAVLQKIVYTASRANIAAVWVDGRPVA